MQQRKYTYAISGLGVTLSCTSLNVSLALTDGFPSVTANIVGTEEIAALVDRHAQGSLLDAVASLSISLSGIRSISNISNLTVTRVSPQETVDGYSATLHLMPRAAALATNYPGVFTSTNYRHTVKSLISAVVSDFNSRFGAGTFRSVLYEATKDPISIVAPRFVQVSYFDMLRDIAARHGLMLFIDFNSNLRVFTPTRKGSTLVNINKHHIIESSLVLDTMQSLVG